MLHLTKVAVGIADLDRLRERMAARAAADGHAWIETRYRPTRHAELVGGSLYWILKHRRFCLLKPAMSSESMLTQNSESLQP